METVIAWLDPYPSQRMWLSNTDEAAVRLIAPSVGVQGLSTWMGRVIVRSAFGDPSCTRPKSMCRAGTRRGKDSLKHLLAQSANSQYSFNDELLEMPRWATSWCGHGCSSGSFKIFPGILKESWIGQGGRIAGWLRSKRWLHLAQRSLWGSHEVRARQLRSQSSSKIPSFVIFQISNFQNSKNGFPMSMSVKRESVGLSWADNQIICPTLWSQTRRRPDFSRALECWNVGWLGLAKTPRTLSGSSWGIPDCVKPASTEFLTLQYTEPLFVASGYFVTKSS